MGEILWRFTGNFDRYGLYLSLENWYVLWGFIVGGNFFFFCIKLNINEN